ncbi:MAG: hypothetical protein A3B14_00200 [Candidatus Zambryskibacteria bacterium RIFCSPLOWO2_01_FULL_45_21]|uniref:Uncharacterized protein n=1 Tax=Candidatus Zambryskibacteria bacterium RIFCSPLOWO2_01_FULL_45_21 TaxID=1802761 RepID=A0A1G2U0L3_9BACT|nr:MAG: hypothetical protein A3B14_00200 [Candidatus Zambryskibacteria bacterium RIFCSPLOWO2_01_FULL_45_21]
MPNSPSNQIKSFWERPEGSTGMVFLALLIGIPVVWLWGSIVPWVVTMLQNTLTAMMLAASAAGAVFLVSNRRVRTLVSYLFKSAMRTVTGFFVEIDPIGIMKNYISDLKGKFRNIREQKSKLSGEIRSLVEELERNAKEISDQLMQAKAAKGRMSPAEVERVVGLSSRQIDRLEAMNSELRPLRDNMEALLRVTADMERQAEFVLEDLSQEVEVEERKRKAMKSGRSALRSARAILQGDDVAKELYDEALEATRDHYARIMGEIDMFVDETRGIASMVNLRDAVAVEKVNARIDAMLSSMEGKANAAILPQGQEVKLIMAASVDPLQKLDLDRPQDIPVSQESRNRPGQRYRRLFEDGEK